LSEELDNPELCCALLKHFQTDFSLDKICAFYDESFLRFVASQFSTLSTSKLETIALPALYHILSHESLLVESEDWLYSFIASFFRSRIR
jgi:hypothetical protein